MQSCRCIKVDIVLRKSLTKTITVDTQILQKGRTKNVITDIGVRKTFTKVVSVDLEALKTQKKVITVDIQSKIIRNKTISVDVEAEGFGEKKNILVDIQVNKKQKIIFEVDIQLDSAGGDGEELFVGGSVKTAGDPRGVFRFAC